MLILLGAIMMPISWYRLVDADYQWGNYQMAASHFKMGTLDAVYFIMMQKIPKIYLTYSRIVNFMDVNLPISDSTY